MNTSAEIYPDMPLHYLFILLLLFFLKPQLITE